VNFLTRLGFALVAALCFAIPSAQAQAHKMSAQDLADVARIEAYFNAITTLSAEFSQIAPDGRVSIGDFYMRRPGRLRFEYAPPVPLLIVADGFRLIFYDHELGQVNAWPVAATPLGPLVARTVDFINSGHAQAVKSQPGILRLTLVDPNRPDEGSITLVFQDDPLELRQWEVTDPQGLVTVVVLTGMRIDPDLEPELFVFNEPGAEAPDVEEEPDPSP
jgi:outer membrane lipoprotein-sorting protein